MIIIKPLHIQERKASHPGGEKYQVDIFFTEQFQGHDMIIVRQLC